MSASPKLQIGVVLTGGGAKGAYQVGCLRALEEAGLSPVAIAGASVGAMHGFIFAAGKLDDAEAIWRRTRWRDVATLTTRRLVRLPIWVLAALASEFSPFKVWRLSDSMTHPVGWRRLVYPLACLAAALGLWSLRGAATGGRVAEVFALLFAGCALLASVHERLRPHFLASSPISHGPLGETLQRIITEGDCDRIRSQGIPLYATTSRFRPYTREAIPWGGWAPRYVRLDHLDRASVLETLHLGSALPGFSASSAARATTVVDGAWTDNVPVAPLLFDRPAELDLLFVVYLKPIFRHRMRHNSLLRLASYLIHKAAAVPTDEVLELLRWAAFRWEASGQRGPERTSAVPRIVLVSPSERVGNFFTGTVRFSPAQSARLIALGRHDMTEAILALASGTDRLSASFRAGLRVNPAIHRRQQLGKRSHNPIRMVLELARSGRTRRGVNGTPNADVHSDAGQSDP